MSESWNIIDGNDVNISEGSDGESIEVIEEEGSNNSYEKKTNKEEGNINLHLSTIIVELILSQIYICLFSILPIYQ